MYGRSNLFWWRLKRLLIDFSSCAAVFCASSSVSKIPWLLSASLNRMLWIMYFEPPATPPISVGRNDFLASSRNSSEMMIGA